MIKKTISKFQFAELVELEEKFGVTLGGPGGFRSETVAAPRVRLGYGMAKKAAAKSPTKKAIKRSALKIARSKAAAKR